MRVVSRFPTAHRGNRPETVEPSRAQRRCTLWNPAPHVRGALQPLHPSTDSCETKASPLPETLRPKAPWRLGEDISGVCEPPNWTTIPEKFAEFFRRQCKRMPQTTASPPSSENTSAPRFVRAPKHAPRRFHRLPLRGRPASLSRVLSFALRPERET